MDTHGKAETVKSKAEAKTVEDFFGPVISMYTRDQALADGVLVDVSELAREAGFKIPVAVTASVWHDCIDWPEDSQQGYGQSIDSRGYDVVSMARYALAGMGAQTNSSGDIFYKLNVIPKGTKGETITDIGDFTGAEKVTLKVSISGESAPEYVTIMKPEED